MAKSLLDKALESHSRNYKRDYTQEELDLACAWLSDAVSTSQVAHATGKHVGEIASWCAARLRAAYKLGMIKVR